MASSIDWATRLVSFDTTSRNSNLKLIDCVAAHIRSFGIEPLILGNEDDAEVAKANLFATFPAHDGCTDGGVVLSGHTDVVPVDGQDWDSDPFAAEIRNGRLYGRGTADMKSYLGVILAQLPRIAEAELAEPIHLAFSYDEEVGLLGAERMIAQLGERGVRPRACIVGEPTSMRVIRGHKSINLFQARFHGVAAHSSLTPQGVNAIHYAGRFVEFFRSLTQSWKENGPFDDAYEVPFTTGGVNLISGGNASNTIPDTCTVDFEFRSVGAHDVSEVVEQVHRFLFDVVEPQMQAEHPSARVELHVQAQSPGLDTAADANIVALAHLCAGAPTDAKVTYGTEAGLFHRAGIETVVCGPGDISVAHAANEYVTQEQIHACERFLESLVEHLTLTR